MDVDRPLAAALVAATLALSGSATAVSYTNCGPYGIKGDVLAHNVGCSKAQAIVKGFLVKAQAEGADAVVKGFSCHGETPGREMLVKCRKGESRVRWQGAIS